MQPCADDRINEAMSALARQMRAQHGITQRELARRTGLDRSYFSMLEKGTRGATLSTVVLLAQAYRIKPSTVVRRLERMLGL